MGRKICHCHDRGQISRMADVLIRSLRVLRQTSAAASAIPRDRGPREWLSEPAQRMDQSEGSRQTGLPQGQGQAAAMQGRTRGSAPADLMPPRGGGGDQTAGQQGRTQAILRHWAFGVTICCGNAGGWVCQPPVYRRWGRENNGDVAWQGIGRVQRRKGIG